MRTIGESDMLSLKACWSLFFLLDVSVVGTYFSFEVRVAGNKIDNEQWNPVLEATSTLCIVLTAER